MFKSKTFEFEVWGSLALFTDPISRIGGEKSTYPVPTVEAIKGITRNIYWKPSIIWHIDEIRVMNQILTEKKGIKTLRNNFDADLCLYLYLIDVRYKVRTHFEWNEVNGHADRNRQKHESIMDRFIERGGKLPIFLGTSECGAYIGPTIFGDGVGHYDNHGSYSIGRMFKNYEYPTEHADKNLHQVYWSPVMENGVIYCSKGAIEKRSVGKMAFYTPPDKGNPECDMKATGENINTDDTEE